MFDTGLGLGSVKITTSDNDQIADLATEKIIYVSEDAPDPIKQQAEVFKDRVRNILQYYVELAKREERATICNKIREAGQFELADAIRRL